ncbi:integrase core domain-containing protein [Streptomyces sp. NPDC097981]|uniref:integrase core domain-containing protein n=1 Tax=Streptomyces sp. NPDC097981 TaxID=3155428 RepID=UPI0033348623
MQEACFDNAMSEAFNSAFKVDCVHQYTLTSRAEARVRIAAWITDFHNPRRLHRLPLQESDRL